MLDRSFQDLFDQITCFGVLPFHKKCITGRMRYQNELFNSEAETVIFIIEVVLGTKENVSPGPAEGEAAAEDNHDTKKEFVLNGKGQTDKEILKGRLHPPLKHSFFCVACGRSWGVQGAW